MKPRIGTDLAPQRIRDLPAGLVRASARMLAGPLGLNAAQALLARVGDAPTPAAFAAGALQELGIRRRVVVPTGLALPTSGPLLAVANHAFGVLDALLIFEWSERLRRDWRYLALSSWSEVAAMRAAIIAVPFAARGRGGATRVLREARAWLDAGHALALCAAGQVASWRWHERAVVEWPWDALVGSLLRRSPATVLPLYVPGRNGLGFQLAAALHPDLRHGLLLREFFARRGGAFELRIGAPFDVAELGTDGSAYGLTQAVRARVLALGASSSSSQSWSRTPP